MDKLTLALTRFINGEDTSLTAANSLEVLLDEAYPDDEFAQSAVVDLASCSPGGGPFLLDMPEVQLRLLRLRDHLSPPS
ncbi:hypothetical protein [Mesorhizobium neociceri]|uniref:Uncharacterized protein n=1 Tax=Mesorhizobium neociceri TaxID=1307853 RepID=A0A838BDD7_9HYPH|nr:hypothetical protein [Mesorhizobium neociceri]MBA1143370.1 hypothetical protein [Mesorhizobium neociceri]